MKILDLISDDEIYDLGTLLSNTLFLALSYIDSGEKIIEDDYYQKPSNQRPKFDRTRPPPAHPPVYIKKVENPEIASKPVDAQNLMITTKKDIGVFPAVPTEIIQAHVQAMNKRNITQG
jgi:hypothetical protein